MSIYVFRPTKAPIEYPPHPKQIEVEVSHAQFKIEGNEISVDIIKTPTAYSVQAKIEREKYKGTSHPLSVYWRKPTQKQLGRLSFALIKKLKADQAPFSTAHYYLNNGDEFGTKEDWCDTLAIAGSSFRFKQRECALLTKQERKSLAQLARQTIYGKILLENYHGAPKTAIEGHLWHVAIAMYHAVHIEAHKDGSPTVYEKHLGPYEAALGHYACKILESELYNSNEAPLYSTPLELACQESSGHNPWKHRAGAGEALGTDYYWKTFRQAFVEGEASLNNRKNYNLLLHCRKKAEELVQASRNPAIIAR